VDQAEAWRRVLGDAGKEVRVDLLANRTHLTHADLRKAATLAGQRAAASGRPAPVHSDVTDALSEAIPDPVSTLARSTRPTVRWSALVLDREVKGQLEEIIQRIEHRVTVQDRWGMRGAEGRGEGLIALFHGDSGTGKTLAVEAIATRIGLPLLRVDLSRVVSKYIGETEKHLGALFDSVEGFRATLFFDEADTLFSNRTGVKDAHDRYANLETNYLLARLEAFEGIALMATNLLQNVDTAFTRRLQFIVHFPRPTPALQRQLWVEHLPRGQIGPDVDLDLLVRHHDLVGGEIRNAALSAGYAAAAAGSSIGQAMLEQGVRSERLKRGKAIRRERG
jgi:SpoVK/Ycf46/Vps4 family AAA+-type ATPase